MIGAFGTTVGAPTVVVVAGEVLTGPEGGGDVADRGDVKLEPDLTVRGAGAPTELIEGTSFLTRGIAWFPFEIAIGTEADGAGEGCRGEDGGGEVMGWEGL